MDLEILNNKDSLTSQRTKINNNSTVLENEFNSQMLTVFNGDGTRHSTHTPSNTVLFDEVLVSSLSDSTPISLFGGHGVTGELEILLIYPDIIDDELLTSFSMSLPYCQDLIITGDYNPLGSIGYFIFSTETCNLPSCTSIIIEYLDVEASCSIQFTEVLPSCINLDISSISGGVQSFIVDVGNNSLPVCTNLVFSDIQAPQFKLQGQLPSCSILRITDIHMDELVNLSLDINFSGSLLNFRLEDSSNIDVEEILRIAVQCIDSGLEGGTFSLQDTLLITRNQSYIDSLNAILTTLRVSEGWSVTPAQITATIV